MKNEKNYANMITERVGILIFWPCEILLTKAIVVIITKTVQRDKSRLHNSVLHQGIKSDKTHLGDEINTYWK